MSSLPPPQRDQIRVGDEFSSFEEAERAIRELQHADGTRFWRRDSKSVRAAHGRKMNPALRFCHVTWACRDGVRREKSRSRHKAGTFKNCMAQVRVICSKDGQKLVVVKADLQHNHSSHTQLAGKSRSQKKSSKLHSHVGLSQTGGQSDDEEEVMLVASQTEAVPETAQGNEECITNPPEHRVTKMSNNSAHLHASRKSQKSTFRCNLDRVLAEIQINSDDIVEVMVDEGHELRGIYYQNKFMQRHFELFPELLLVDGTFTLANPSWRVYVHFAVDGNGESEIVAVFVVNKDAESISPLIDLFKHYNPALEKTQKVLTDKVSTDREAYRVCMPQAQIGLCPLYTALSLEQEISLESMSITPRQRLQCLELLRKITYSSSVEEYQENVEELYQSGVAPVISYFKRLWHPVREEWVLALNESCLFRQSCTEQVAAVHYKLSNISQKSSDPTNFFHHLKLLCQALRLSRENRLVKAVQNLPPASSKHATAEVKFSRMLTPYAFQVIRTQLSQAGQVYIPDVKVKKGVTVLSSDSCSVQVTATSCTCQFATVNRLPCRHIFAFRAHCGLDLFLDDGVGPRWCLRHYKSQSLPSAEEKDQRTAEVAERLVNLTAGSPSSLFEERMDTLRKLAGLWKQGKHVSIIELVEMGL